MSVKGQSKRENNIVQSRRKFLTADKISSSKYISRSEYTARARLTRAFSPPERLIPRSPISALLPPVIVWISSSIEQTRMASRYLVAFNDSPNKILWRKAPLRIQGCWAQYATVPSTLTGGATNRNKERQTERKTERKKNPIRTHTVEM